MKSWKMTTSLDLVCGCGQVDVAPHPCCGEGLEKTGRGVQGPFMDCLMLVAASVLLSSKLIFQKLLW